MTDTMLAPLAGATVSILGSSLRVVTGANGKFHISDLPPGQYIVLVNRIGFEAISDRVRLAPSDTERLALSLDRAAAALDTVKVAGTQVPARLDEFEARYMNKLASAAFNRDDILKVNPVDTWQMLRRVPSLRLIPNGPNGGLRAMSSRAWKIDPGTMQAVPCYMNVMIDGVMMAGDPPPPSPVVPPGGSSQAAGPAVFDLMNLPAPDQIHGIEVFAGPERIPPQYNGAGNDKMCGLIAIWTR